MRQLHLMLHHAKRLIFAFLLTICMMTMSLPCAFAAPTGDISNEVSGPGENMIYVDMKASVPDNFNGTVYVLICNENSEYFTVSCNDLSGYEGTAQVPVGSYYVEKAYTSEDHLAFEAFVDVYEFEVGDRGHRIDVTVKYSSEGDNYSENFGSTEELPPDDLTPTPDDSQSGQDATDPEVKDEPTTGDDAAQTPADDEEKAPDLEDPEQGSSLWRFIRGFVIFLIGSAVFTGIVFLTVYLVRKKNG